MGARGAHLEPAVRPTRAPQPHNYGVPVSSPSAPRRCVALEVPPGPLGLDVLMPALRAAMDGSGPAIAVLPGSGSAQYRERIRAAVQPGEPVPDGVAVVLATSGSTGDPAGVLLPADSLRAAAVGLAERTRSTVGHRWVAALPLHHAGGLMVAARSIVAGTTPIATASLGGAEPFTVDGFAAATQQAHDASTVDGRPLAVSLVPPMLAILDEAGAPAHRTLDMFDVILVGGAATPQPLLDRLRAAHVNVLTSYGMTEACGGAVFDGRPLAGVDVSVSTDGHLRLCGAQVAIGYRDGRHPERWHNAPDGRRCFTTADVGRVSDDGVVIEGRADDVVQVAGVSVSLSAVRSALQAQPGVAQAEVAALPDDRWGARLVAVIVPTSPWGIQDRPSDARDRPAPREGADLADAVAAALGRAARPREVRVVPSIPMLESGKVDRRALADIVARPPAPPADRAAGDRDAAGDPGGVQP